MINLVYTGFFYFCNCFIILKLFQIKSEKNRKFCLRNLFKCFKYKNPLKMMLNLTNEHTSSEKNKNMRRNKKFNELYLMVNRKIELSFIHFKVSSVSIHLYYLKNSVCSIINFSPNFFGKYRSDGTELSLLKLPIHPEFLI